jgi:hypothetical protein
MDDVIKYARKENFKIIAAEVCDGAVDLRKYSKKIMQSENLAVIF